MRIVELGFLGVFLATAGAAGPLPALPGLPELPGGSLPPTVPGEGYAPRTRDPRATSPGLLMPKVPRQGPDEPYVALVFEVNGAATALFLERDDGQLYRIELPRTAWGRGRLFRRFAVSIEPGSYHWVGFHRWHRRRDGRWDVYEVMDVKPVPLLIRTGAVSHGGRIETRLRRLARVNRARRRSGQVIVHPSDFEFSFRVIDEGAEARERMARTWPWIASRKLDVVEALVGPGDEAQDAGLEAPVMAEDPGAAAPRGWGYRPAPE